MSKQEITQRQNQQPTQQTLLKNLDGNSKIIQQTFVYCALMVGLKPEKFEIDMIIKFVILNYPTINNEEIIQAFQLNSSGKHWKTAEHYGSFSTLFVGKILTSFETHKRNKIHREQKALPSPEKTDIISHAEAKEKLKELGIYLKKINSKFKINNK